MGTMHHHAVIATTWDATEMKRIRDWVGKITFPKHAHFKHPRQLFLFGDGLVNGEQTVVMIPDGSKEGWPESDDCNALRAEFITELQRSDYEDGSSPWCWVEVGFGELGQQIHGNNVDQNEDEE